MAERIAFPVYDASGNPKPDAVPTFTVYKSRTGVVLAPPAITHIGGGVYGFQPNDTDTLAGVAYLISTGAGGFPSYHGGAVFVESSPFTVALLTDAVGGLWAGAVPTVGIYNDFAGAPRTAPALLALSGTHFYALVPSLADLLVGAAYRIDGPVGALPRFTSGSLYPPAGPTPPPLTGFEAFEGAVQACVVAATAFPGSKVIWANQTRTRPARPFVELYVTEDRTHEHSEHAVRDNPAPLAGQEIFIDLTDHRDLTVQMRAFSSEVTGSLKAMNVANQIRRYFHTEACQAGLGDIAVVDRGPIRDATLVLESEHEGRAILDIVFRLGDLFSEATTYIQQVVTETTITHTSGDVVRTITTTAP